MTLSLNWKLSPVDERLLRVMYFLARLSLLSVPLYLVIWLGIDLFPLQAAAAGQAGWILQGLGFPLAQEGISLTLSSGFQFFIIPDCTGWKSMLFLFALVFAAPGISLRKRLIGLAGLPLIWVANLSRIVLVVWVQGLAGTEQALFLHDTLFQAYMIAWVLAVWLAWLLWAKGSLARASWRQK